jgi:hypothetical protein
MKKTVFIFKSSNDMHDFAEAHRNWETWNQVSKNNSSATLVVTSKEELPSNLREIARKMGATIL